MRKIEEKIKSLLNSFEFDYETSENLTLRDKIKYSLDKVEYFLWDSRVLWKIKGESNIYYFSCCGWDSMTTLNRLRTFLPLHKKKGKVFVNNQEISVDAVYKYDRHNGSLEEIK
jgi:hypothetical protein